MLRGSSEGLPTAKVGRKGPERSPEPERRMSEANLKRQVVPPSAASQSSGRLARARSAGALDRMWGPATLMEARGPAREPEPSARAQGEAKPRPEARGRAAFPQRASRAEG